MQSPLVEESALRPYSALLIGLQEFHTDIALQLEVGHMRPVYLSVPLGKGVGFESVEGFLLETHFSKFI